MIRLLVVWTSTAFAMSVGWVVFVLSHSELPYSHPTAEQRQTERQLYAIHDALFGGTAIAWLAASSLAVAAVFHAYRRGSGASEAALTEPWTKLAAGGTTQRAAMPVRRIIVCAALGVVPLVAGALLWFGPSGAGEHRDSPDGRYRAYAYNMSTGTVFGDRDRYLEIRMVENSTREEVWRVIHRPTEGEVPFYGLRGAKFVTWADDSSSVSVPVCGGRTLTLAVP